MPGFKPLTVVAMAAMSTAPFAYSDVDPFVSDAKIVTNSDTARYFNNIVNYDGMRVFDRIYYEKLRDEWARTTRFYSSPKQIIEDKSFQAIVSMGRIAVPYILEDIRETPSTLVWALNLIFNYKISGKRDISIEDACKLWVRAFQMKK